MSYCNACGFEAKGIKGFFSLYNCHNCGENYCSDCWEEGEFYFFNDEYFNDIYGELEWRHFSGYEGYWICKNCWKGNKLSTFRKEYNEAIKNNEKIKLYSENYLGDLSGYRFSDKDFLETEPFESKNEAEQSLRVIAYYYNYDVITKFNFIREKHQKGNYIYSDWIATGFGAKHKIRRK